MPHYEPNNHLGRTICTLCSQRADEKSLILVPFRGQYTVNKCPNSCLRCSKRPSRQTWHHKSCYDILTSSYGKALIPTSADLEQFGEATRALYPALGEKMRRFASIKDGLFSDNTKHILEGRFRQGLLYKLPQEILNMILHYMILEDIRPCRFLVILGESRRLIEQLRNSDCRRRDRISLSRNIYITRTEYQGVSYIRSVSNTPLISCSGRSPLEGSVHPPSKIHKIILHLDHIGIRNIQFLDQSTDPLEDGSPWYKVIPVSRSISNTEAHFSNNGLFLQSVQLCSDNTQNIDVVWTSSCPPTIQTWNFYRTSQTSYSRLHYAQLSAGVKGLVVCCLHAQTIGLHAFSGVSKDFERFMERMKQRPNSHLRWIFFPFNACESACQIWIRQMKGCEGAASDPVIVLRTSLSRMITFGPYIPVHLRHMFRFHSLLRNGDGPVSGLYHNGLDPESRYISEIGITCGPWPATENIERVPPFDSYPIPSIPPRGGPPATSWYMMKAPLRDLVQVQICQDKDQPHHPCIGFLLYYENGLVESLGQIRWDRQISGKISVPIRIQRSQNAGKDYIKNVLGATRSDLNMVEEGWQELPKDGTLVWWFGHIGDKLELYD